MSNSDSQCGVKKCRGQRDIWLKKSLSIQALLYVYVPPLEAQEWTIHKFTSLFIIIPRYILHKEPFYWGFPKINHVSQIFIRTELNVIHVVKFFQNN